ncbi:MAG TPA: DUF1425 domain-containing protein [Opitutaceae bacterium]|nr:DUF1425 domain-containing protein [Opitutaceae bacterium]
MVAFLPHSLRRAYDAQGRLRARSVRVKLSSVICFLGLAMTGCVSQPSESVMLTSPKYSLEQTEKLQFLDPDLADDITSTGIQHSVLADGRLQVVVNIRNRANRRYPVQLSAIFRDNQGFATGDETPWQRVAIAENSTEAVRFISTQTTAKNFTVRVKAAR